MSILRKKIDVLLLFTLIILPIIISNISCIGKRNWVEFYNKNKELYHQSTEIIFSKYEIFKNKNGMNYYILENKFRKLAVDKRALVYIYDNKITTIGYGLTDGLLIYDSESIIYTTDKDFLNKPYIEYKQLEGNWYYTLWH